MPRLSKLSTMLVITQSWSCGLHPQFLSPVPLFRLSHYYGGSQEGCPQHCTKMERIKTLDVPSTIYYQ